MPSPDDPSRSPLVPAHRQLAEITLKALILGIILSMLLAAANAYIGLLVGLTVSASIPAAAVSMGVLRLFRKSNILENNMVQTAASAGEALVAGIIFTLPALVMMNAWSGYDYGSLMAIAVLGGLLGVAFTIPLRRALIVEAQLTFPEGVATAAVLKSGGITRGEPATGGSGPEGDAVSRLGLVALLRAAGLGALFKLLESGAGLLAGGVSLVKAWAGGLWLLSLNLTLSPALVGVGYIVGLNIAILVFLGGLIGTVIGVPLNWLFNKEALLVTSGLPVGSELADLSDGQLATVANNAWSQCRRVGVGAMMVGGLWSLVSLARPLWQGIKTSIRVYRASLSEEGTQLPRTERDTPFLWVGLLILASIGPLWWIFHGALEALPNAGALAALMTLLMLVFGFLFASVAGYMAGLVGSSNNPISGVTIATVITSALILVQLLGKEGIAAQVGPIAVMFLAGLICSAAAIAGDNMQDLKCGHLLGATPWRQQLFQVVGVLGAALVIPWVLQVLDLGYGIGRPAPGSGGSTFLAAPQASLMKELAVGIFGLGIDWLFVFIGAGLAVVLILLDSYQQRRGSSFRFPVLAVAVGIYLPLGLSVPIFIGGLLVWWRQRDQHADKLGVLRASGLITGEALMGVVVAVVAAFVVPLPLGHWAGAGGLGLLALVGVILYLGRWLPGADRQSR